MNVYTVGYGDTMYHRLPHRTILNSPSLFIRLAYLPINNNIVEPALGDPPVVSQSEDEDCNMPRFASKVEILEGDMKPV